MPLLFSNVGSGKLTTRMNFMGPYHQQGGATQAAIAKCWSFSSSLLLINFGEASTWRVAASVLPPWHIQINYGFSRGTDSQLTHINASRSVVLRKASMTLPYFSIDVRNGSSRFMYIMLLLFSCSLCSLKMTCRSSSRFVSLKSFSSFCVNTEDFLKSSTAVWKTARLMMRGVQTVHHGSSLEGGESVRPPLLSTAENMQKGCCCCMWQCWLARPSSWQVRLHDPTVNSWLSPSRCRGVQGVFLKTP